VTAWALREQSQQFTYADLTLTGIDALGCFWRTEDVAGWFGSPPVRRTSELRAGQHGQRPTSPLRGGRTVTLSGKVYAPDSVTLEAAARRISAAPLTGTLSGASPWGALLADVEQDDGDGVLFAHVSPIIGRWSITLTAPDPLLYGPPSFTSTALSGSAGGTGLTFALAFPLDFGTAPGVTPGVVEVPNAGTETYWPRIRIDGPVPNPKVTVNETGDFVRLGFTLSASQWVDVDCGNRRVLLNGQSSITRYVTFSGNWLAIPPGGASMSITADAADPAAALSVFHYEGAWL
jgi:hypothetical protein